MLKRAETRPGIIVTTETQPENVARSIICPFKVVEQLVDLSVPPRRPAKRHPTRVSAAEADAEYRRRAANITPSNDQLKSLAKQFPAPSEWHNENGGE